jgi:FkbM family methyltransferase
MDIEAYFKEAISKFKIKSLGLKTPHNIPYVMLENGLIFHGLPTPNNQIVPSMISGPVTIIGDLEYRYSQLDRKFTQHSHYTYKPGDVVVELGAYLGYYSMHVANEIGPTGRIIAVEMVPTNFNILELNLKTNFPECAVAVNKGVHRAKGVRTTYIGSHQEAGYREDVIAQHAANYSTIETQTDTVDNILRAHKVSAVDLMIVQVNGNEIDAIKGMQRSLPHIKNIALAAMYDSKGLDHGAFLCTHLEKNHFKVTVNGPWVYAKRRAKK